MSDFLSSKEQENIQSCQVDCLDSHMHYLRCGEGKPILLLHGMPGSSFMWRSVLPGLAAEGCCIAPDLIGVGHSGVPDSSFSVQEHIRYVEAFIEALHLEQVLLVVHGWGSVIGLDIASRHPERFRGVVMCEAHLRPTYRNRDLTLPMQELLKDLSEADRARRLIVDENFLVESWLPLCMMKKLNPEVMAGYRSAFADLRRRQVLLRYVQDLPVGRYGAETNELITHYSKWLSESSIPKLLLYAMPGFVTSLDTVAWAGQNFQCLDIEEVADFALHFIPETAPESVVEAIKAWHPQSS